MGGFACSSTDDCRRRRRRVVCIFFNRARAHRNVLHRIAATLANVAVVVAFSFTHVPSVVDGGRRFRVTATPYLSAVYTLVC